MEMMKIVGIGLISLIMILLLSPIRPDFSAFIRIVVSILLIIMVIDQIIPVFKQLEGLLTKLDSELWWFNLLVKMIGIAYIAEFASELCRDAGEGALASKIELGAKVIIVVVGMPVFQTLIQMISFEK